jgi:hypothetical protein
MARESWTALVARWLALKFHPLTHVCLLEPIGKRKCKHCESHYLYGCNWSASGKRNWYKCRRVRNDGTAKTDCKANWPACVLFKEKTDKTV